MASKTYTATYQFSGVTSLVIGAFLYWCFWGVPGWSDAIPFVAMMFLWPLYLLWLFLKWFFILGVGAVLLVLVFGLLWAGWRWVSRKLRRNKLQRRG